MNQTNPYLCIEYPARRTIVVGDIHGCWTEFQQLLEETRAGKDDLVITVGDFMDRGPGSWEIARYFKSTPNAFSVQGNHERRVAGVVRGRSQPAWSQKQSLSLLPETEHVAWAEWMESLPSVIETPHSIITHARLDPTKPITNQDLYFTAAVGGAAVTIELDGGGVPLWFRQMRFEKPVCMGHICYERIVLVPDGLYALDTGAVRGGQLTALVFPGAEITQVAVGRNYHAESLTEWRRSQRAAAGDPMLWPLVRVVETLSLDQDMKSDYSDGIKAIKDAIAALGLDAFAVRLRAGLQKRFGNVPPPGAARGEYYKGIKQAFNAWGVQHIAVRSLSARTIFFKDLAVSFPDVTLQALPALLMQIERGSK